MSRALGICAVIAALLVGCVSVNAPSAVPPSAPSFGITTPAPVATPTTAVATASPIPTVTPTPAPPSSTPTVAPTETPPDPTASPVAVDNDLIFSDDLSDPTTGWGLNDTDLSTISYQDDALRIVIHAADGAAFSGRVVGGEYAVLLAAAEFVPGSDGAFGLLCSSADGVHYGAALTTSGALVFFKIEGGQVESLDRINDIGSDFPANQQTFFGLECAGTATGALRLVAVLPGSGALGFYQVDEGPATFNGIAAYGEGFEAEFAVDMEQVAAYGIAGSAVGMTPEAEELLTHVPDLLRPTCTESPVTDAAVAILHCYLQPEGVGAELAEYQSYATNGEMDVVYQERVAQYEVESTGDCQSGPDETTWNIGDGPPMGRILCAPQQVGIRFDWTDDSLSILSVLIDFDSDYENTHALWLEAGPI